MWARGLDLSHADLIKSHLYGRLSYEYYLLAQNPKHSLYEELIDKFKGQDPKSVIYEFKKFVDDISKQTIQEFPLLYLIINST
jgi:hypothetical protein